MKFYFWIERILEFRKTAIVAMGLLAFFGCAWVGHIKGFPVPQIHDEFSYLLAGETFAMGRITNPPHPMWEHFETFHVLQQPTYMSKYHPMQGIFLALGIKFFGHPIYGVWLSEALMVAAVCWMLQAWASPVLALVGSLIVIVHPSIGVASLWAQSYWGGAVQALGGAMLFGGLRRLSQKLNMLDAIIMGLGMTVLVNSRPFEGVISILPVLSVLLYWLFKKKDSRRLFLKSVILPLFIIGAGTLTAMGYYNKTITGNPLMMPYVLYEYTHSNLPYFRWQKPRPEPVFHNAIMRDFQDGPTRNQYEKYSKMSLKEILGERLKEIYSNLTGNCWIFKVALILALIAPFFAGPWVLFLYGVVWFYILFECFLGFFFFHYYGPFVGPTVLFMVLGLQMVGRFKIRRLYLGNFLIILYVLFMVYFGWHLINEPPIDDSHTWYKERQKIIDVLTKAGGKHLIIVAYSNDHLINNEWVFNGPDIDNSPVIWARDLGSEENQKLVNYFKDRKLWILIQERTRGILISASGEADQLKGQLKF